MHEAKRHVILLLGAKDAPIPSQWHLQKEMFILSRAVPKIDEFFSFEKHYDGPFSSILKETVEEPLYHDDAYQIHQNGTITLTKQGRDLFKKITKDWQDNDKFADLLKTIKLTRKVYDRLGKDELLFLAYQTYPQYIEASNIYERLVIDKENRVKLADSLFAKGLITDERHNELKKIGR